VQDSALVKILRVAAFECGATGTAGVTVCRAQFKAEVPALYGNPCADGFEHQGRDRADVYAHAAKAAA